MADYSIISSSETFGVQFDRAAAQLRCALPGVLVSFAAATQTAEVRPAIKLKVNLDGQVRQIDLPVLQNVPVLLPFAQSAGLLLTLPLRPGDECLLVFADRAIDNFVQSGGLQPGLVTGDEATSSPRCHSLTDAICIPGLISNPQAVPAYSTDNIELRDRARAHYLSLGPGGLEISDGQAVWKMSGGQVSLSAPAGISYATPANLTVRAANLDLGDDNRIRGNLRSENGTFTDKNGVNLNSHRHNGGAEPDK